MTLGELNEAVADGSIDEVIRVEEARQVKALSRIADEIDGLKDRRLVLLAGGSSAGKTTTAKRLATQLRVAGHKVLALSTDDYFVGDARNPRDENGELDYEHVECVDIERLSADVNALLVGEPIFRRRFDFVAHTGAYTDEQMVLPKDGIVLIEGIHALNPRLTEGVDEDVKYRVFIEPKPGIEIFLDIRPSSAEARFLRRIVRDNQFRKINPSETYRLWPKVRAGEAKWIEPFRSFANVTFNSYLDYELAVLKPYALGLLERMRRELGEVTEVVNMIRLLKPVSTASMVAVPGDSILRETIGGSQLDY